jgi:hypothetical protein
MEESNIDTEVRYKDDVVVWAKYVGNTSRDLCCRKEPRSRQPHCNRRTRTTLANEQARMHSRSRNLKWCNHIRLDTPVSSFSSFSDAQCRPSNF